MEKKKLIDYHVNIREGEGRNRAGTPPPPPPPPPPRNSLGKTLI